MEDTYTAVNIEPMEEGDDTKTLPKPSKFKFARKFCETTSLHGFQYIGDKNRSIIERLCWILAVCLSIAACYVFIYRVYSKWVDVPIYVAFAEESTSIIEIPFPAITICPGNKIRKSVFDMKEVLEKLKNDEEVSEDAILKFGYRELLCRRMSLFDEIPFPETTNESAIDFIEQASYEIDDIADECLWRNYAFTCSDLFTPVITDEGFCHTFNILKADELLTSKVNNTQYEKYLNHNRSSTGWSMENGYKSDEVDFPFRTASAGSMEGLSFLYLEQEDELVDSCGIPTFGLQVLIDSPVEYPQVSSQFFYVPAGHDVAIGLQANYINTSENLLEAMTPYQRRCFMSDERKLYFFKVYTEANCEFECFVNETLISCNCSAYYMPRTPGTPICGAGMNLCLDEVLGDLYQREKSGVSTCRCLPSCTEYQYNAEVSESKISWSKSILGKDIEGSEISRISIYFKRSRFVPSRRSELYGLTDFIANCGGLVGLFMGFSFLSLVEVVYFLLMRPLMMAGRTFFNRVWPGSQKKCS